jgi:hypothetical protein
MRGKDEQQLDVFSYISPEQRVPQDHPLRPLRVMTDEALRELETRFNKLYAKTGLVGPFSGLMRRAILKQMKAKAEATLAEAFQRPTDTRTAKMPQH